MILFYLKLIRKAENKIKNLQNDRFNESSIGWNVYIEHNSSRLPPSGHILNTFYDTGRGYDYKHPTNVEQHKQFTQLVWKGSMKLGCAYQHAREDKLEDETQLHVLCLYYPAGNTNNTEDYRNNVLEVKTNY